MRIIFRNFNKSILLLFCLAMVMVPNSVVQAEESVKTKTFVVIGTATVRGTNVSGAREAAISDTLVTAVALMTEELLQTESLVDNFQKV
jgi:hypothetical protein